ncbi:hypothetical protein GWK47_035956 [Chionoecetes opilio]|uniref:Uncharacterized protein n=1 Tax=Chionoecetes opilio TaxID=41210 RepID=A0A8J4YMT9_CHIOP|nr:hypothetical protein GWK47_035956 [Chionoecetes opilio]
MQYNAEFRGGQAVKISRRYRKVYLVNMSTDQQMAHTAQSLVYMWTRKQGLTGKELNTLEILVKYCRKVYFKLYYNIKVHHRLEDGPKHILTQPQSDKVAAQEGPKTAVTFYVRTGAWFAHSGKVSSSR